MAKIKADVKQCVKNQVKAASKLQGISEAQWVRDAALEKLKTVQK